MNFKAKLINTAYEISTIISFAFTLDFIIICRNMNFTNQIMLVLWLSISATGVLRITLNRIILNRTKEPLFEKALVEIKENFNGNQYAPLIYMLLGVIILCIRIAIPFIIAL